MQDIRIYDRSGIGSFFSGLSGHVIIVSCVEDMVTKVLRATANQRTKSSLYLCGYGNVNYQSVGGGENLDASGTRGLLTLESSELHGVGRTRIPMLSSKIAVIHPLGVNDDKLRSYSLMQAVAGALGPGGKAVSNNRTVWCNR